MRYLAALLLLAACTDATGQSPQYPTVLVINQSPDTVWFRWVRSNGFWITNQRVLPGTHLCMQSFVQINELRWAIGFGEDSAATYTSDAFNGLNAPTWDVTISDHVVTPTYAARCGT